MGRRLEYEVKTSVRLNMSNPQHVKINDVIQNLDPKIFKSKNQFIIDAIQFYIDNYGKETFVIKKKEKERAEYIRSEDIDDIKEEVIEAATNEARKEVIKLLGGVISGMNVGQPVIMQAANSEAQEPTEDVGRCRCCRTCNGMDVERRLIILASPKTSFNAPRIILNIHLSISKITVPTAPITLLIIISLLSTSIPLKQQPMRLEKR